MRFHYPAFDLEHVHLVAVPSPNVVRSASKSKIHQSDSYIYAMKVQLRPPAGSSLLGCGEIDAIFAYAIQVGIQEKPPENPEYGNVFFEIYAAGDSSAPAKVVLANFSYGFADEPLKFTTEQLLTSYNQAWASCAGIEERNDDRFFFASLESLLLASDSVAPFGVQSTGEERSANELAAPRKSGHFPQKVYNSVIENDYPRFEPAVAPEQPVRQEPSVPFWEHLIALASERERFEAQQLELEVTRTRMLDLVESAHNAGATWLQLGEVLGMPPKATQQSWSRAGREANKERTRRHRARQSESKPEQPEQSES